MYTRIHQDVFCQALDGGDAVCLFPEGASRFHPTIAPLKTGGTLDLLMQRMLLLTDLTDFTRIRSGEDGIQCVISQSQFTGL